MLSDRLLPRPFPEKIIHEGNYVRLEPLSERHVDDLWNAAENAESSWEYLRYGPFEDIESLRLVIQELASRSHQPFWAVVDRSSNTAKGWLSICDVYPHESAAEIGSVWFSPSMQRSHVSTEAVFILMEYVFDRLGYARLVWRCFEDNISSRRAAERYGFTFEGIWRSAVVAKGKRRDIRWHSMLITEWPARRRSIRSWLNAENFDQSGKALRRLADI